ncbi:MAG: hypothetical protein Q7R32_05980 [Dehalococcoidia bacterium]|nr:hypothetical protein [Dehalococcoidia bacterium]
MPRPVRTREGVFLLAAVLAGVGFALAVSGSPIALTVVLFVASAALFAGGVAAEVVAFLTPRHNRTPESVRDSAHPTRTSIAIEHEAGEEVAPSPGARRQ